MPIFGWIEKDGDLGDNTGPTSLEETVYLGQTIEANVVVNINPCFRWSDLHTFLKFACFVVEIPGPWNAVGWVRWAKAHPKICRMYRGTVNCTVNTNNETLLNTIMVR